MLKEINATGRELLELAHDMADSGIEVFASIADIGLLWVHKVIFMESNPAIAQVYCWPGDDGKSVTWLIPLAAVRGIKSEDR